MIEQSTNDTNDTIDARLSELGLTITAEFVPASTFKNDKWRNKAINFTVTITKGARPIYNGPYAYGVGNLPGYVAKYADKLMSEKTLIAARETGRWPMRGLHIFDNCATVFDPRVQSVPAPTLRDVVYSLLSDSFAIDAGGFEAWCADYGCDTDSRKAESTYNVCLDVGLKLRAALGDTVLAELRELFQDY